MNFISEFKCFLENEKIDFIQNENLFLVKNSNISFLLLEFETLNESLDYHYIFRIDTWVNSKEMIKNRIRTILGLNQKIYGRQTKILKINQVEAKAFLIENHFLGFRKAKIKYGCFFKEELIGVMTFNNPKKFLNLENEFINSYELIQFSIKLGISIIGGLDKFLSQFVSDYKPDEIMTYLDVEWGGGKSWENLGFELKSISPPIYFEINPITFQKTKIDMIQNSQFSYANLGNKKMVKSFRN